eukprot:scaffold641_cov490-Prasinococcus_capsulatus_cf.AAC.1
MAHKPPRSRRAAAALASTIATQHFRRVLVRLASQRAMRHGTSAPGRGTLGTQPSFSTTTLTLRQLLSTEAATPQEIDSLTGAGNSHVAVPVRISVEGNIGVGKSTLLQSITEDPLLDSLARTVFEPVNDWKKVSFGDQNLLDAYYSDPRYCYAFQNYVFMTRLMQHRRKAVEQPGIANSHDVPYMCWQSLAMD